MAKAGGLPAAPSRQMPAIARKGASFKVNRCLALGYFLPVNSKNAEAGIRQRLLLSKCRPSDLKLNAGRHAVLPAESRSSSGQAQSHCRQRASPDPRR